MSMVGIIANPSSGKDIRRIVAQALVVGNREKANIVSRMLVGLHASGIKDVHIMPDKFRIGTQAIHNLGKRSADVVAGVNILDMEFIGTGDDSIRAASLMNEMGVKCIIVLGGDGTVRVVAKTCGEVPILPVSTGTNNVLPQFIEGTLAGLAAGLVAATGDPLPEAWCYRSKYLDILINGQTIDMALVDVAVLADSFVGSRAVWNVDHLRQIVVTRASPASIGISSIIGVLNPISISDDFGACILVNQGGNSRMITAPIGPGLISIIPVQDLTIMEPDQSYPVVSERPLMLALDGEREIYVGPKDEAAVALRLNGVRIVNSNTVLEQAGRESVFVN
jgi:predicted polyphosphate/ATP-dependent NAD kinase